MKRKRKGFQTMTTRYKKGKGQNVLEISRIRIRIIAGKRRFWDGGGWSG